MADQEQPNPEVRGITERDFVNWRHHPATKVFLAYLQDYRAALHRVLLDRWEAKALTLTDEQEIAGRCRTLAEMADLPFAAMLNFYSNEDDNAGKVIENRTRPVRPGPVEWSE